MAIKVVRFHSNNIAMCSEESNFHLASISKLTFPGYTPCDPIYQITLNICQTLSFSLIYLLIAIRIVNPNQQQHMP